jgi:transposase
MAMTIVEVDCAITGGVDTHLNFHVASALDHRGGLLGTESFAASPEGSRALLTWLRGFGTVTVVGVEGTGAYGAGLARYLATESISVIEVDRPNRQARRRQGKSDTLDAIEAARAAQSGRASGLAKSRDGAAEALRVLLVAKHSARRTRAKTITQMRYLSYSAPDQLRCQLKGLSIPKLLSAVKRLRPGRSDDVVTSATKVALSSLAARVRDLEAEIAKLDEHIAPLVEAAAPELLALFGVGIDTAATLLVAAGDNPERVSTEAKWAHLCGVAPIPASSGEQVTRRYRLDPGGNRQANCALWRIVIVRLAHDPNTKAYMEKRLKDGKSKREVVRILKRYVAREVYRTLPRG